VPGCAGMAINHQQQVASGDEQGTSSFIIHHSSFIIHLLIYFITIPKIPRSRYFPGAGNDLP
jgi:hypothetical protein